MFKVAEVAIPSDHKAHLEEVQLARNEQVAGFLAPKCSGCWCCGEMGHDRAKCPKFAAIKAKNTGKVPKDYVGAYEKSLKARVSCVNVDSPSS